MRSGLPMNHPEVVATDTSQTAILLDRPNLVLECLPLSTSDWRFYLNRAAFQNQAAGTFGNLGRNVLIAPGAINFDVALSRTFRIRERWQLTPRAEAFNVINHANFPLLPRTSSPGPFRPAGADTLSSSHLECSRPRQILAFCSSP